MAPKTQTSAVPNQTTSSKPKPVATTLGLPTSITSPSDVGRLMRELEKLDDNLLQLGLRAGGSQVKMPATSHLLDKTVELNKLNLLKAEDRKTLQRFLAQVRDKAPVLHMSFSADPTVEFTDKLIVWLRREIHPLVLLTIGLQPNIGAGCSMRSTNKYFDLSLRQTFVKHHDLLLASLAEATLSAPSPKQDAPPAGISTT